MRHDRMQNTCRAHAFPKYLSRSMAMLACNANQKLHLLLHDARDAGSEILAVWELMRHSRASTSQTWDSRRRGGAGSRRW